MSGESSWTTRHISKRVAFVDDSPQQSGNVSKWSRLARTYGPKSEDKGSWKSKEREEDVRSGLRLWM